ncbi:DNA polymerase III subunit alpha [bacterium]|nr:DNA polymerase III subunit alpha [bacterium]
MNNNFIHLHCHTEYSLLDGALKIPALVKQCKDFDMPAIAITDNANLYGAIDFYTTAKNNGLNPIIGCEVYLTDDISQKERARDRLILLSKNYNGYQNLIEIVTISHLNGFYYKPRIDLNHLKKYADDLIAISPGFQGPVANLFKKGEFEKGEKTASTLQDIYHDNFYLGIQSLGLHYEDIIKEETISISKKLNIEIVATNDVYYCDKEDAHLRDILVCIQTGKKIDDENSLKFQTQEKYLKSPQEMAELFKDIPEALSNTIKIAEQCRLKLDTEQVKLPKFECPDQKSSEQYLKELVYQGLALKYQNITEEIKKRAEYELQIITKMYYSNYFLIICDFLNYARLQNIPFGPGRGSAAGSIVAYALDITKIDPLKYKLLFERFLNPERVSMPDIDLDFCIKRRYEIIEYISQKYGNDHVSQIITFGTMASRGVIRDVGRVLDIPLPEVDFLAKLIPSTPGNQTSIQEAIKIVPELNKAYQNKNYRKLLDIGIQLEGFARHTSTHAAGVVVSSEPLSKTVPLTLNEGQPVTQFSMAAVEKIGLLKLDILGLRNLTVLQDTVKRIKNNHNLELDLNKLPLNDKKTFKLLCAGETIGVFQLEGSGMRKLIKDLQPKNFEDIIALLALYRPGPLGSGMVNDFVSNKNGKTKVKYDLPILKPILQETHGMILYQEQVMQIAHTIGGFSMGQADMLRKAMGKKKKNVMEQMKVEFLNGAMKNKIPLEKAAKIFELCYKFAEYGFNKSHSAAYALISYQTAYLKANYPIEYLASLLTSVLGNIDKVSLYIAECQQSNIKVLPPNINKSKADFTITPEGIRFGLGAIKNVGDGAIESINKNVTKNGPFTTLSDFCLRVDLKQVNKRVLDSLIKCGAFDEIEDRNKLLSCYESLLESAQATIKEKNKGQSGLFSDTILLKQNTHLKNNTSYIYLSPHEKLKMEKELMGLYVSGHPLKLVKQKLAKLPYNTLKIGSNDHQKQIIIGGILSNCRRILNKNKKEMIAAKLEDLHGSISVLMFQNESFDKNAALFQDDNLVRLKAKVSIRDDSPILICNEIELLENIKNNQVHIDAEYLDFTKIAPQIKQLCQKYKGKSPLYFHINGKIILTHEKYWLTISPETTESLYQIIHETKVWIS